MKLTDDEAEWPPLEQPIHIGHGMVIRLVVHGGQVVGIQETHLGKDGQPCQGWLALDSAPESMRAHSYWHVVQKSPLTLSPSIRCRTCGWHGFIDSGRWVLC